MKIKIIIQWLLVTQSFYSTILIAADNDLKGYGAVDRRPISQPARNSLFSCEQTKMGRALTRSWLDSNGVIHFAKKPTVEGGDLNHAQFEIKYQNNTMVITGNGVPSHPTGKFPVERTSKAFQYDRNPNSIQAYTVQYRIPIQPEIAEQPSCLPMGAMGIALTGAVFFNPLDAYFRDAVANEIFDQCEGHPQRSGVYHYHHLSPCLEQGEPNRHSPLIGYALDGFAIYGPRGENGHYLSNADLDECHGHYGKANPQNKASVTTYHYHANNEFPYILGCFKGKVEQTSMPRHRQRPGIMKVKGRPQDHNAHRPDLSIAAKRLGISIHKLRAALGAPPPDYRISAQRLGISAETLHNAMREAGAP